MSAWLVKCRPVYLGIQSKKNHIGRWESSVRGAKWRISLTQRPAGALLVRFNVLGKVHRSALEIEPACGEN
jgi:hypothetical protein